MSTFKNKNMQLKNSWGWNFLKNKNNEARPKSTDSYLKKACTVIYFELPNVLGNMV